MYKKKASNNEAFFLTLPIYSGQIQSHQPSLDVFFETH